VSRTTVAITDPNDLRQIAEAVTDVQQIVDARIEFGNPHNPANTTALAGSGTPTTHNGQNMNILGRWVEIEFEALDTAVTVTHNLGVPVFNNGAANELNVRYLTAGIRHSGAGVAGTSVLSFNHDDRDAAGIGVNSFQLRAYAPAGRTVNAANPIRVSLFVIPANRWPD
jgi:hypothetical protein